MAKITFKTKVQQMHNVDDTLAYEYVVVPVFERKHCDMQAFRSHPKHGGLANSDLFKNVLAGIRRQVLAGKPWIRLDDVPDGVNVDTSKFLAVVTIDV